LRLEILPPNETKSGFSHPANPNPIREYGDNSRKCVILSGSSLSLIAPTVKARYDSAGDAICISSSSIIPSIELEFFHKL
jgi:hypothetical protein